MFFMEIDFKIIESESISLIDNLENRKGKGRLVFYIYILCICIRSDMYVPSKYLLSKRLQSKCNIASEFV